MVGLESLTRDSSPPHWFSLGIRTYTRQTIDGPAKTHPHYIKGGQWIHLSRPRPSQPSHRPQCQSNAKSYER